MIPFYIKIKNTQSAFNKANVVSRFCEVKMQLVELSHFDQAIAELTKTRDQYAAYLEKAKQELLSHDSGIS